MNLLQLLTTITMLSVLLAGLAYAEPIAGIDIGREYEARVLAGIEANRKSGVCVRVVDENGIEVVGATVGVKQTTHDFIFGCAFPSWSSVPKDMGEEGWANWNKYFTKLFNYTTSENSLKWKPLEREQGEYRWAPVDFMTDWCNRHNVQIKGHTLVWGCDQQGVPQWLMGRAPEEVGELVKKRTDVVMGRCKNDIHIWDVVNEPVHCHWFEQNWDKDYIVKTYQWAHQADPTATLVINDYAGFRGAVDQFVPLVDEALKKGAPIDAMGEQAHDPPYWYSPQDIFTTLDKMASTGLDIHLTELTYPSSGAEITGGFMDGKWTEQKQAEFYRYFVTLCFSHPKVEAITLWAMWDGSTWLDKGGIIRKDWTPKPAYRALDELINDKWKTCFTSRSDTNGEVRFRGFHGSYEITVTAPDGSTKTSTFHLAKGQDNQIEITLK